VLVPPSTDKGLVPTLRFSFADAHMNLQDGGWSREVTQRELPVATEMAGVNMRLKTGGVRELYWHKQAEWSIMLAGNARITAVDNDGKNFIADVAAGDLWYFPAGIPHSIQGLGPDGCEFLLAFPHGSFSESSTFLLSEESMSHYVQNTGAGPLKFLELFRSPRFEDVSLNQWLALTPAELVKAHLGLDQNTIDRLSKNKKPIV
jgi:oxalate decarboxylase/phosphoglucose isomerase-like protein (cupin superfamily)